MKKIIFKFIVLMLSITLSVSDNCFANVTIISRAQKVCQIIGDFDKHLNIPTINLTEQRYNLPQTDLGVPFTHNGKIYILFGDTWTYPIDDDPIAFSDDFNLEDGLSLTFIQNENGAYRPVSIPGVQLSSFEVPMEGVSINNKMYIFATTGHTPTVFMGRSVLAVSTDNGYNFSYLYDYSSQYFINLSIVKIALSEWEGFPESGNDGLVILGSGSYRESDVRLAFQPVSEIESPASRRYYSGQTPSGQPVWSINESDAIPLFSQPYVGELSVSYNKFISKWILLYNAAEPRGINMRTADDPWGPWSTPQILFHPWDDQGYCHFIHTSWEFSNCDSVHDSGRAYEWGGEYGPYQFEDLATGNPCTTTIYFTLSTWNPYTVVLMKASLARTYSDISERTDYDKNGVTNLIDFSIFSTYWLTNHPKGDLAPFPCGDGIVNIDDLRVLVTSWLQNNITSPNK